jgi:hypothetical protein
MNDLKSQMTINYMTQRKAIGILGMILGFACILGGFIFAGINIKPSISAYYHSNMRDILVGVLVATSVFLFSYKGYDKHDNFITNLLGVSALGIALFPCKEEVLTGSFMVLPSSISGTIHLIFALTFFLLLAYNSIFLFTKSSGIMTEKKIKRNKLYRISGVVILVSCAIAILPVAVPALKSTKLILIAEIIMLIAFGISWVTKGDMILKDMETKVI